MVTKYDARRDSLNAARKLLLQEEKNRVEDREREVRDAVAAAFLGGRLYFRGATMSPGELGSSFAPALHAAGTKVLPELFPSFVATQVQPSELLQLIANDLSAPSPKFLADELGILELDGGRYVPSCSGVVVQRIHEHIDGEGGLAGVTLLQHFGRPPYGYTPDVVKACVAGLLRASKVRIQPEGGAEVTAVRDAGVREIFEKDRAFRRATFYPAGEDDIGFQARARICKFFKDYLGADLDREDNAIADAVSTHFPTLAARLRDVLTRHRQVPNAVDPPPSLVPLDDVLQKAVGIARQTKPTVKLVKSKLDVLRDGVGLLRTMDGELTPDVIAAVRRAHDVARHHLAQLEQTGALSPESKHGAERIRAQLESERPWVDVRSLEPELERIQKEYVEERTRLLSWQEAQRAQAADEVKDRAGFSTLDADQSHHVLRPIAEAMTNTAPEAIAPPLSALKDPFLIALQRAQTVANERLDELLSEGDKPMIKRVSLGLRNREVGSEEDLRALLDELEARLRDALKDGARVRLV